jgi:hypothetical protein
LAEKQKAPESDVASGGSCCVRKSADYIEASRLRELQELDEILMIVMIMSFTYKSFSNPGAISFQRISRVGFEPTTYRLRGGHSSL